MKRRIVWLVASCLMVAALLLASCAPAAPPEEKIAPLGEKAMPEEKVVPEEKAVELGPEVPRYGGWFTFATETWPRGFDEARSTQIQAWAHVFYSDDPAGADWAKGPAGTGEASYLAGVFPPRHLEAGRIAETWETPDDTTIIMHIRKGVHYGLDSRREASRLVNGREVTAEDVAYSLIRIWTLPTAYSCKAYPWDTHLESITATDKWTVVIKTKPGKLGMVYEQAVEVCSIQPKEVIEKYGDTNEWKNVVGTGPFFVADCVQGSSLTFDRNPNYWQKDPCGPGKGNQLPYLDGVLYLCIPDASTRMAAMRTGKIDHLNYISWEDAEGFMKTNPELKYVSYPVNPTAIHTRVDKPELPWYDLRVRRALSLAINQQEIIDTYFGGHADLVASPNLNVPELKEQYVPFDKLPESAREQFTYDPEKAKRLLAEAGYPNGFKISVLVYSPMQVDLASIVAKYWADIGVDLKIDIKEFTVYTSTSLKFAYDMLMRDEPSTIGRKFMPVLSYHPSNFSRVNDPKIDAIYEKVAAATTVNEPELFRLMRESTPYILERVDWVRLPAPHQYTFWQPWVMNYHGEDRIGYLDPYLATQYMWIDQDLKYQMTGKR